MLPAPEILTLQSMQLVGLRMPMSLSDNRTTELWRSFMPRRKELLDIYGTDLFSVQVYPRNYFTPFNPNTVFDKWATMELNGFIALPEGMETLIIPTGVYARFSYRGPVSAAPQVFSYIFWEWLPASGYQLDHRPHFEKLGEKYKGEAPDSEEDIFIPLIELQR